MKIEIRHLKEKSGRFSSDEVVVFRDISGEESSINCRIDLGYQSSGSSYFFHGEVSGKYRTPCHLCLEDVSVDVSGEFDVVVRRGAERVEPADADTAEDYILLSLNDQEICFDDFIYESLVVNIPMQILCTEDCRGLCPTCGVNRNTQDCTCGSQRDPRWDALRKLKDGPSE